MASISRSGLWVPKRTGLPRGFGVRAAGWVVLAVLPALVIRSPGAEPLRVTATTSLVGDIVRRVGGDAIALTVLIPPDADPHAWTPRPVDVARATRSDLVFENGFGLEESLASMLRMPEIAPKRVAVSDGIEPRYLTGAFGPAGAAPCSAGHAHGHSHGHAHESGAPDPHVWFNPLHVQHWAHRIERALAARRPEKAAAFAARRADLVETLEQLDAWIREQVDRIPPEQRVMVSDHESFGYFADRYGFRLMGAVVPGLSTLAQPSARDLARLQTRIRESGVRAVFVGISANPIVTERLAADTGIRVVRLYTGSLSGPNGPAADYDSFMRTNTSLILQALE